MLADGGFSHTVTDGSLLAAAGVAALVGVVGFLSPCVLPLVPGYLSYVAGLSGDASSGSPSGSGRTAVATRPSQRRMVAGALLFVLGFTAIFVAQGAIFGALSAQLAEHRVALEQVLGSVTIVMGVVFLGFVPALQREARIHRLPPVGLLGAPLLGIVFGAAWLPCQTPTLGAVDSLAAAEASAGRGAFLQVCYCMGLGIPFVLVALGFSWVTSALTFVRRHRRAISRIGGLLLIAIGVLLVTGQWEHWMATLQAKAAGVGSVGDGL